MRNIKSILFLCFFIVQVSLPVTLSQTSLQSSQSSSLINWSSEWINIREESRHYKKLTFCSKHFKAKRDVCSKEAIDDPLVTFEDSEFLPENCHCDDTCSKFGDCCIDKSVNSESIKSNPWSCADVPISRHGLYTYQSCHPSWRDDKISHLCKSPAQSFLQWLPAYSRASSILYRNLYCALCNVDSVKLHDWNITVICDQDIDPIEVRPFIRESNFNHSIGLWAFTINGTLHRCKASLPELEIYDGRIAFGTRLCRPSVGTCSSDWPDHEMAEKCAKYTFLIGSSKTNTIYRNIFCARCNNLTETEHKRLTCDLTTVKEIARAPPITPAISLRMLFDVESYSSCRLEDGQVYNPLTSKCMTVQCEESFHINQKTLQCESWEITKDGFTLKSDCLKVFLNESDYLVADNDSIILSDSGQLLTPEQYEPYIRLDRQRGTRLSGILTCYDENHLYASPFVYDNIQGLLSFITLSVSILGLLGYLGVTLFVPKLRNLRTLMVMSLSVALLLASISFVCGVLSRPHLETNIISNERGSLFCVMTAVGIHYFYLAAFAWMNVMAYDAWKSFKRTHERLSNSMIHFLKYSLYSWLLPAAVVLTAASFDLSNISSDYKPFYGHRVCWISQKKALLAFFVLPVSVVIMINICFFSWTAAVLVRTNRQTRLAVSSKHVKENSQRFILYARLATIMGLTWIFGILAALTTFNWLWYPFILLNGLQGAFIFFYFTWKKEVFNALRDRIAFLIHGHEPVSASYTSKATRSSSLLPSFSATTLQ